MPFRLIAGLIVIGSVVLLSIIAPLKPLPTPINSDDERLAAEHCLYAIIPRHRSQIAWYDFGRFALWALLGNDDDGIFGERVHKFHPELPPSLTRACLWTVRNPFHNFCFYVIGSADRKNSCWKLLEITPEGIKTLDYQPEANTVFAGTRSSFLLALHGGKPFFSICWQWSQNHQSKFYLGWRCRGNFGAKCVL